MLRINELAGFGDILGGAALASVTADFLATPSAPSSVANDTIVMKIPLTSLIGMGSEWQLELKGIGTGSVIGDIYFGEAASSGDAFDFKASPAPVLAGTGFTLDGSSPLTLTSAFAFSPTGTSPLMISFNVGSGGIIPAKDNSGSGFVSYNRNAVQQASTVNKSTYVVWGTARIALVNRIFTR